MEIQYQLRVASPHEIEDIYRLRAESYERTCAARCSKKALETLKWGYDPIDFAQAISAKNIILLEVDGTRAGFLWVQGSYAKEICVFPDFIGTSIARRLIMEIVRIVKKKDCSEVEIFALPHTVKLYERYGFVEIEKTNLAHRRTGTKIPMVRMVLNPLQPMA